MKYFTHEPKAAAFRHNEPKGSYAYHDLRPHAISRNSAALT